PSCPDLEQHLVLCDDCSEAAACLALHRGGIPGALADGLLGWGGVAYLERRHEAPGGAYGGRRAQRLSDRRAAPGQAGRATVAAVGTLFVPAALVAFLLVPSDPSSTADAGGAKAPTVAGGPEWPDDEAWERVGKSSPSGSPDPSRPAGRPSHTGMDKTLRERPRPTRPTRTADAEKTAGERSRPARPSRPAQRPKPSPTAAGPACKARYQLVHQWGGGFRADVEITYNRPLHGWQLTWSFSGGQHIKQMWSGNYQQYGPRVTVNPVDYNTHVAAGQSFTVGFLADAPYQGYNPSPGDIVLNGSRCTG
ncbi:MAG TPA: cellulose binding domain-containing protein, partial [Streptomyces sp.]|nr:cellulose binding domain-containing protein [Streptomyces sp.]